MNTVYTAKHSGPGGGGGGGTPYIRMIGMIVVLFLVVIGDLVFFRGCSSKIL